jgi:RNA polymerase sigma-70 factor (ECF subfamily)
MHTTSDEAVLLRRAADGDARAFADLVGMHRERTWAVCYRITGHRHDAEDALQVALTAAWRTIGRFRGDALFGTWLHRIATNAALRIVQRRREVPTESTDDFESGSTVATEVVERDALQRALAVLPPPFRVALVLRVYGDLTYAEIAEFQEVDVQTVKSRLNRARRAVHTLLSGG